VRSVPSAWADGLKVDLSPRPTRWRGWYWLH